MSCRSKNLRRWFFRLHSVLIALEHETIDIEVIINKLKQKLRQELIANKNFYQDFHNGNIVNNFYQYLRTWQNNSSICNLVVRLLCNALKIGVDILQKDSANNKVLKFTILPRTEEKLNCVKEFIRLNKLYLPYVLLNFTFLNP